MPEDSERRKDKRSPKFATIISFCDGVAQIEGAVINVSEGGMSFITDQALEPGLACNVKGKFRLDDFSEECKVVWNKKVGEGLFRIGISYDEHS